MFQFQLEECESSMACALCVAWCFVLQAARPLAGIMEGLSDPLSASAAVSQLHV